MKQAILDHLGKREDLLAQTMKIDIVSVNFRDNQADAVVSVSPKEGGAGIQINYTLLMEGNKWVVKPAANPHGGAAPKGGALPAGHPPTTPKAHP